MNHYEKPRLVVFDVEGVLVSKNRFLFDVSKSLGFFYLIKLLFLGFLYETGIRKLDTTLRQIYATMKNIEVNKLMHIFDNLPATPYLERTFSQLKARNCHIAIISSGIPTFIVRQLANCLGAEYAYGVEIEQNQGKLTGQIHGAAIDKNGKLSILQDILKEKKLMPKDCIIVADDRNNSCIFLKEALKIGFNPDYVIRVKADRVVNGSLSKIIPIIDGESHKRSFPSVNDLVREDIHAAGIFMPVIAGMIGVPLVATAIFALALIYILSELARLDGRTLPVISAITNHAASQSELYGFAASPLYFAFGIATTLILFPLPAASAAIAMFCLGDSAASLFGGLISTSLPFNKGKTWEGSLAGFLFAFLGGAFFISPLIALAGAAIAMTIEVLPLPVNDNVLIPIITGAVLSLLLL